MSCECYFYKDKHGLDVQSKSSSLQVRTQASGGPRKNVATGTKHVFGSPKP